MIPIKIAAAYIRVSTDDQIEFSPDSQRKNLLQYAKTHDMILPEEYIFVDEGISGRGADKRPAFQQMIGVAKTKPKPFDVILLWKFSRFARNREDSIVYKSMLRKQLGIDVISISESIGDDKMSVLIEAMIEAMDEYYSINLAEEVRRGMLERASRGLPVSIPAFGYNIIDKMYVPNPETAPLVMMLFESFLAGEGTRTLAAKLNAMDIRTSRGGRWENRTIEYILRNPVYIGKIRWNPARRTRRDYDDPDIMVIDVHHEPLVGSQLFDAVQARLDEQKELRGRYQRDMPSEPYMLHGLVKCSSCGSTLTRSSARTTAKSKPCLQCHLYTHGKCEVSHYVVISKLNAIVIATLDNILNGTVPAVYALKPAPKDDTTDALITAERRKLDRVKAAYEAGIDSLDEYRENKRKILARIELLEAERPSEQQPEGTQLETLRAVVEKLKSSTISESEKNELLRSVVGHIIYHKSSQSAQIFLR